MLELGDRVPFRRPPMHNITAWSKLAFLKIALPLDLHMHNLCNYE